MFRIIAFNNKSTTEIQLAFSSELDESIGVANIKVLSNIPSVADLSVKSIRLEGNVIGITTSPQTPLADYHVLLLSTQSQSFQSRSGVVLQNSPAFNRIDFIGLEAPSDIRDAMVQATPPVYDANSNTLVRKQISIVSDQIGRAKSEIDRLANANYLYESIVDERKVRGPSASDKLDLAGAFDLIRVARLPTGATAIRDMEFSQDQARSVGDLSYVNQKLVKLGTDPVSLRFFDVSETVSNSEVLINSFDGLKLALSKKNVARVNGISLISGGNTYHYDIPAYKYALSDDRFDSINCNVLKTLASNQIRLSESAVLNSGFPVPSGSDEVLVNYTYVNNGIDIDADSVEVFNIKQSVRESIGSYLAVFSLQNFPVVDSLGNAIDGAGIVFLDPNPDVGDPFGEIHPAFANEIEYSTTRLPAGPGEYSVDYSAGRVFVYGENTNNGTGAEPPVCTYYYKKTYSPSMDYAIDSDTDELVAISGRQIANESVTIRFSYDQVLVEGEDFVNKVNREAISEFVDNRFSSPNKISTLNYPITDVFEVVNDTTGEIYNVSRFDDYSVYIYGRSLPRISEKNNEVVVFSRVTDEGVYISEDVLSYGGGEKAVKAQLQNSNLVSLSGNLGSSSVNTSVTFSNLEVFSREFFYDSVLQSLATNLAKLTSVGDFCIDYLTGEIYVRVQDAQATSLGSISYSWGSIKPARPNVSQVDKIEYRPSVGSDSVKSVLSVSVEPEAVVIDSLPSSLERFLLGDSDRPILLGAVQWGVVGQGVLGGSTFSTPEASFEGIHDNGNFALNFVGDFDRAITNINSTTSVDVDIPFSETDRNMKWVLLDNNFSDGYKCVASHDISFVRGVYSVQELQTLPREDLVNYFDGATDTFSGNVITFNNDLIKQLPAGTALAVDYHFGTLFVDYSHVVDNLRISYEYGNNSLDFSISDALRQDDEYYVSYRFGALRDKLLPNFGALTQVDDLAVFPLDFNRELYRDFIRGSLSSFVKGPTVESISSLVETVTSIKPQIRELSFDEWTSDRDNLHLENGVLTGEETYVAGANRSGLLIGNSGSLQYPAESYISHKEGTIELKVRPQWDGLANDAALTFDIGSNGVAATDTGGLLSTGQVSVTDIYIGSSGWNPASVPFTISRFDESPYSPVGKPVQFGDRVGYYVWFDDLINRWNLCWAFDPLRGYQFSGAITTSGEFHNVQDGYNTVLGDGYIESNDRITSTSNYIRFDAVIDGYDAMDGYDGYAFTDGYLGDDGYTQISGYLFHDLLQFSSDNTRYLLDSGNSKYDNRLSLFKDASGYISFRVIDDSSRLYQISHDVSGWVAGQDHMVSAAWRFNSANGVDEMHLGVDGQEVANAYRFGGRPVVGSEVFRAAAEEVLATSLSKTIIGGMDGISDGSAVFSSASANFITNGILAGDLLTILDSTVDGAGSPYAILSVDSETQVTLTSGLTLSLSGIKYSVNATSFTVESNVDLEDFSIYRDDGISEVELNGLDATAPDYTVSRADGINTVTITGGASAGDQLLVRTLGLSHGRNRDVVYNYLAGSTIKTRLPPPVSSEHFDVYKIILMRASIESDGYSLSSSTGFFSDSGNQLLATFADLRQPSNLVFGKKIKVTLGGTDNIDFSGTNSVTIYGTTYAGPTSEVISFSDYGALITSNFFTSITSVDVIFEGYDTSKSFGSIDIRENSPLTRTENSGDYAQLLSYDNGRLSFVIYGSGGVPYVMDSCYYQFDYPVALNIPMSKKGKLVIGADIEGANSANAVFDEVVILNDMLDDVRVGEDRESVRTITSDFNNTELAVMTPQTMMLLDLDRKISNVSSFYKLFDSSIYTSSSSVNEGFGDSLMILDSKPLVIDNASGILNNSAATIEFWVSPYIDTFYDQERVRYYFDMTSLSTKDLISTTTIDVEMPFRVRDVRSVRLFGDDGTGTDYFESGKLRVNGTSVVLGRPLPSQNTKIVVEYTPVDFSGDRVSIYKDGYGSLNFGIAASGKGYIISCPIGWSRNTWHRVKATWTANSTDGKDRMMLFVDGQESGTITYGTSGLLWGSGIVYGQSAVGSLSSTFLTDNIDLTDTMGDIVIGNSFDNKNPSRSRFDNLRFSSVARQPHVVAGNTVDLDYNANLLAAQPVVEDSFTTALYDFGRDLIPNEFMANLLDESTPNFLFDVIVDDGFLKLTSKRSRDLLVKLIKRMKPAHANVFIKFLQEYGE